MAGRRNPTFLKRQKEQQRTERASAKRAARQARRMERATVNEEDGRIPEDDIQGQDNPENGPD